MLVRRSGDLADAEDALQDALLAATTQWPDEGVPDNPRGWLVVVGQHKLVDRYRSEDARRRREERAHAMDVDGRGAGRGRRLPAAAVRLLPPRAQPGVGDRADPALARRADDRGDRPGVPGAGGRRWRSGSAARAGRCGSDGPFRMPEADEYGPRLRAVLRVLYLMFNEGYASTSGPSVARARPVRRGAAADADPAPEPARRPRGGRPAGPRPAHRRPPARPHGSGR